MPDRHAYESGEGRRCSACGTLRSLAEEPGKHHWYHPQGFCPAGIGSTGHTDEGQ